ncbi:MAG: GIY-YIG nuclease family protein [Terracidiphilus sp.]
MEMTMQSKKSRKEWVQKFKEQKPLLGAYAVRCSATGRAWVGVSRNLGATRNGNLFMLRSGLHRDKMLQADWDAHGESAFEYEILDCTDEGIDPLLIDRILKEMKAAWVAQLGAQPLL